jgi:hypothetical protein
MPLYVRLIGDTVRAQAGIRRGTLSRDESFVQDIMMRLQILTKRMGAGIR